ncbi:TIGR02391 family protein [Kribbella sp. NPDC059898]|uniref:TIGR02391 family protein n=1 Tax=Kribbella sp. NPDC059898 TaxID=3346995 RepID=UPI003650F87F
MNLKWMVERILAFRTTCVLITLSPSRIDGTFAPEDPWFTRLAPRSDLEAKYRSELPTFLKIARALEVALPGSVPVDVKKQAGVYRRVTDTALGVARDWEAVKKNLAPDGPTVGADQFHPHVWAAAAPLWGTGQYRVAVGAAATSLSAHIAQKAGSDLTDRTLVQDVFAPKVSPGRPRLHFPGDRNSDRWRSRQEGLHLTAQGAFAGIRNVAAHSHEEWSEQYALEVLAVLSVVARWTDQTELRTDPIDAIAEAESAGELRG